jgi:hypothetical protein
MGLTRRHLFGAALGAVAVLGTPRSARASAPRGLLTTLDLVPPEPRGYGSVTAPGYTFALQNGIPSTEWVFPGSAATASARAWPADIAGQPILRATWRLVWNPMGDPQSGAQIIHALERYLDWGVVGEFTGHSDTGPIHTYQDVTAVMNDVQLRRQMRYLAHRLRGAAVIFASTLEVVWNLDAVA